MKFDCSKTHPCEGIVLQDIDLRSQSSEVAKASCLNVRFQYKGQFMLIIRSLILVTMISALTAIAPAPTFGDPTIGLPERHQPPLPDQSTGAPRGVFIGMVLVIIIIVVAVLGYSLWRYFSTKQQVTPESEMT
ncbi:hypothetical protein CRG98_050331 [Punica granatum]|uniref:Uncharacterized protein n=1 Tax=Punica granatum TaxID=22663 RepID=A0A2I0GGX4_PUNGR|nr:hypothetical protein CRG98_050331 [Punica granatum]